MHTLTRTSFVECNENCKIGALNLGNELQNCTPSPPNSVYGGCMKVCISLTSAQPTCLWRKDAHHSPLRRVGSVEVGGQA